jgi:hypothetical protein
VSILAPGSNAAGYLNGCSYVCYDVNVRLKLIQRLKPYEFKRYCVGNGGALQPANVHRYSPTVVSSADGLVEAAETTELVLHLVSVSVNRASFIQTQWAA